MRGINLPAILVASLAVIGVDFVWSFLLISLFGGPAFHSATTEQQFRAATLALLQDVRYLTGSLIFGTASTVLGGFLAARLARAVPYFNALAFGILGLILSAFAVEDVPTWFQISSLGIIVPAALLGGHLAKHGTHIRRS